MNRVHEIKYDQGEEKMEQVLFIYLFNYICLGTIYLFTYIALLFCCRGCRLLLFGSAFLIPLR